ncbi:MAG: hypothetical protein IT352_09505 [Gemmatimonadales bacterium]|nr:hypothetical protein [Gemmatimonadales bacterium]
MRSLVIAVALAGTAAESPPPPPAKPLVVVVNRVNPIAGLTRADLSRLFLGAATLFPNEVRVTLMNFVPERARFYKAALGMSEDRVRRHWISLVFAGETARPPAEYLNEAELLAAVAAMPGAIAFIPAGGPLPDNVKAIPIDGRRPGDPGYLLP